MARTAENRDDPIRRKSIENDIKWLINRAEPYLNRLLDGKEIEIGDEEHIGTARGGNAYREFVTRLSNVNPLGRKGINAERGRLRLSLDAEVQEAILKEILRSKEDKQTVIGPIDPPQKLKKKIQLIQGPVHIPVIPREKITIKSDLNTPDIVFVAGQEPRYIANHERIKIIDERIKRTSDSLGHDYDVDAVFDALLSDINVRGASLDSMAKELGVDLKSSRRILADTDKELERFCNDIEDDFRIPIPEPDTWEQRRVYPSDVDRYFDLKVPQSSQKLHEIIEKRDHAVKRVDYLEEHTLSLIRNMQLRCTREENYKEISLCRFDRPEVIELYLPCTTGKFGQYIEDLIDSILPANVQKTRNELGIGYIIPKKGNFAIDNLQNQLSKVSEKMKNAMHIGISIARLGEQTEAGYMIQSRSSSANA